MLDKGNEILLVFGKTSPLFLLAVIIRFVGEIEVVSGHFTVTHNQQ